MRKFLLMLMAGLVATAVNAQDDVDSLVIDYGDSLIVDSLVIDIADSSVIDSVVIDDDGSLTVDSFDSDSLIVDSSLVIGDTDSLVIDSLIIDDNIVLTDSVGHQDTAAVAVSQPPPKLTGTLFGFGAALSVGTIPVFTMWQNTLPNMMSDLGITAAFGNDLVPGDTALLRYRVIQAPDEFNFVIPFTLSIHSIRDDHAISLAVSFFQNVKRFQSELSYSGDDTLARRVNLYEMLAYTTVSLEAAYHWSIPPVLFSVDRAQETYFTLGAGVSPFNYFTRSGGVTNRSPEDDERMRAVADTVQKRFSALTTNGMALSWRAGITTVRAYAQGSGLEMGLYYTGSYSTHFSIDGERLMESGVHPVDEEKDRPLTFISNRIEFRVSFLIPHQKRQKTE
ncbi:MAG: hypothetical protein LBC70_00720 [Chitinispirillales bacterium]|jgi:hypothetical protein|nr:hypothetical protein [Chitinispirillales bacterium]